MEQSARRTSTSSFGVGRREGHDASRFYERFTPPELSSDETINRPRALIDELGRGKLFVGAINELKLLPENSVSLVVTSPPYFVGKEYELAVNGEGAQPDRIPATYLDYLEMLREVFAECVRCLEPGGRVAINVANLGRKPYRSLAADVISILQDDLGLLLRGEVIWEKSSASSGSCAWGSFALASNPVLRDVTERVIVASKGRFARAKSAKIRRASGLPHESTIANDEFVETTRDIWRIDAESARRVGHPAPFPLELPRRLIDLYTYRGDIVVDPFAGSGTTLIAAARTGRIGVGFDTDASYIDLAERRLNAELSRIDQLDRATGHLAQAPANRRSDLLAEISFEDRQEHFQARAVVEGKKVQHIAARLLSEAGFASIDDRARHPSKIIEFDFRVTHPSGEHHWWVDVSGAFTTTRPGLQKADAVWKLLGKLNVLGAIRSRNPERSAEQCEHVLVLTSNVPKPGSAGDKALRAVGPLAIFDVVELYDPAGLHRLERYASGSSPAPLPGFWSAEELTNARIRIDPLDFGPEVRPVCG